MAPKVKISKIPSDTFRRDMDSRFVTHLVEIGSWKVAEKSFGLANKNKYHGSAGGIRAPILPSLARSRPKLSKRRRRLTCPCVPTLVRIG